jgi:hypothetical protein
MFNKNKCLTIIYDMSYFYRANEQGCCFVFQEEISFVTRVTLPIVNLHMDNLMKNSWLSRSLKNLLQGRISAALFPSGLPLVLVGVLALAGCSKSGLDRATIEGIVTFEGKKVLNGDIRFVPIDNTSGSTSEAPIVDGRFIANYRGGVPVGKHLVMLRAFILEDVGAASNDADVDLLAANQKRKRRKLSLPLYKVEGRPQFLPPEYNTRAGLKIEVTGDQNPQIEDFNLLNSKS